MSSAASAQTPIGMSRVVPVTQGDAVLPASALCSELEAGNIVFFAETPFAFPSEDLDFLLASRQTGSALHKNIAYRPAVDRITGLDKSDAPDHERLKAIVRGYSRRAAGFVREFLTPYAGHWKLDFASYRPLEERGRPARIRARNDLPHVDAFPTRPTNGDRILRFFTNINPTKNRVWITSQTFEVVGPLFAKAIGLPRAQNSSPLRRTARALARALHLPGTHRSPYDDFMHRCHNAMKEDSQFQEGCPKQRWEFPPHSSWIVFTDCVSHAVLEGQNALEQTFIVSRKAMIHPEKSPVAILERLAGGSLSNPD
jgi:3-deoxy-D-manno-octulosonic acid hydroxylase-like protein